MCALIAVCVDAKMICSVFSVFCLVSVLTRFLHIRVCLGELLVISSVGLDNISTGFQHVCDK
jgi:hypothetical protein